MALVLGEPRSATIVAVRDTELLRLPRTAFDRLLDRGVHAHRFLVEVLSRRVRDISHRPATEEAPRTLAILPLSPAIQADDFAKDLAHQLHALGRKVEVLRDNAAGRDVEWFAEVEKSNDVVVYQARCDASTWTRMCVRQADRVLLVLSAGPPPNPETTKAIDEILRHRRPGSVDLVILHGLNSRRLAFTRMLLGRYQVGLHCHVREGNREDLARLARMIAGRAISIVLSGGGARGFAHIGVLRALREARVPLDIFAGASMGSIIGAGAAMEWDEAAMLHHFVSGFVENNPLNDYTLPIVALARGRKVTRLLRKHYGDTQVEECWRQFMCTASDLSSGQVRVFRTGPVWKALRASVAIPGVVTPVVEGDHVLVDGGVLNNMPIDLVLAMRRGPVIAVDVERENTIVAEGGALEDQSLWNLLRANRRGAPNIIGLLMRAGTVGSNAQIKLLRPHVDLLIEPPLTRISMLDWKSYRAAIDGGYRHAIELLEKRELPSLRF
jgi:NTE family protein